MRLNSSSENGSFTFWSNRYETKNITALRRNFHFYHEKNGCNVLLVPLVLPPAHLLRSNQRAELNQFLLPQP